MENEGVWMTEREYLSAIFGRINEVGAKLDGFIVQTNANFAPTAAT